MAGSRNVSESERFYDEDEEDGPPPSPGDGSTFAFG